MRGLEKRVLAVFFTVSALVTLIAGLRWTATPHYSAPERAEHVVVIGVPSLDWDVITPETMPHLWQAAETGAVGMMTTRAARSVTCPWDGWVTLGAGNRARYPAPIPEDELPTEPVDPLPGEPVEEPEPTPDDQEAQRLDKATEGCLGQRGVVPTVGGSQLDPVIAENDRLAFGAEPAALGSVVGCTRVVGPAPVLAVAADGADVRRASAGASVGDWSATIGECPLTLVATSHALERTPPQLLALDEAISSIMQGAAQRDATVIVAGISEAEYKRGGLTALVMVDESLGEQVLSSPSTGRAPYSQLIDLAPTIASILGEEVPSSMVGQVLRGQDRDDDMLTTAADFRQNDVAALGHMWMSSKFFVVMSWLVAIAAVGLAVRLARGRAPNRLTNAVGIAVASLSVASLLANLFPWWSMPRPTIAMLAAMVGSWIACVVLLLYGPWRRYRSGPMLALCVLVFGTLAFDVLTGSHLQLNSPLGYNAIVAGRFTGFGNQPFAIFSVAGLVLIAAASALAQTRRTKTAVVAVGGLALVALDGLPGAGSDFGGVIALLPSLLLMWFLVVGVRLTWRTVVIAFGSGAIVVAAIAVLDYLRPAQDRTHIGRFTGQVLDGTAGTIIVRKLVANWRILTGSTLTILAVVLIAVVVWQWVSKSSAGRAYVQQHAPQALAAVVGVLVVTLLGFAVNDSGIAITAAGLSIIVPPLLGIIGPQARSATAEEPSPDSPVELPSAQ